MSSSPPTTLGKYQIIREIARSNDIVYEAYDPLMNRRVAVKELAMPSGSSAQQREDRIKRFLREARAVGSLTHKNIMTVFEVGEEGDRYFIAMEYLDGHTLRNEIDTHGFLPLDKALDIAIEILHGLEYAHSKGVIHRDIKPDNIQLLSNGEVKLTDFGIARLTFEPNLTMDGQVFGTPSYMSPEQVVGREIDARSDLFSVGIVLYEMVAGVKPFGGDSVVTITYAIMNKEPDQPQQCNYALWQVIGKALDKSPQLRYASASDMIRALEDVRNASTSVVLDTAPPVSTNPYGGVISSPPPQLIQPPSTYPPQAYGQQPYPPPQMFTPVAPAPPPTYPYNPYSSPGAGSLPPHSMPTGFHGQPVPVYYPPPPREPLIKPETRKFITQLLLAVLVLGTLAGLIIIGVSSLADAVNRQRALQHDQQLRRDGAAAKSIDERIQKDSEYLARLSSETNKRQQSENIAQLYAQKAAGYVQAGQAVMAEDAYQKAISFDANNPSIRQEYANLLLNQSRRMQTPELRAELLLRAADGFRAAAGMAQGAELENIRLKAARTYFDLSLEYEKMGDRPSARNALYNAREFVERGSTMDETIRARLRRLGA